MMIEFFSHLLGCYSCSLFLGRYLLCCTWLLRSSNILGLLRCYFGLLTMNLLVKLGGSNLVLDDPAIDYLILALIVHLLLHHLLLPDLLLDKSLIWVNRLTTSSRHCIWCKLSSLTILLHLDLLLLMGSYKSKVRSELPITKITYLLSSKRIIPICFRKPVPQSSMGMWPGSASSKPRS